MDREYIYIYIAMNRKTAVITEKKRGEKPWTARRLRRTRRRVGDSDMLSDSDMPRPVSDADMTRFGTAGRLRQSEAAAAPAPHAPRAMLRALPFANKRTVSLVSRLNPFWSF